MSDTSPVPPVIRRTPVDLSLLDAPRRAPVDPARLDAPRRLPVDIALLDAAYPDDEERGIRQPPPPPHPPRRGRRFAYDLPLALLLAVFMGSVLWAGGRVAALPSEITAWSSAHPWSTGLPQWAPAKTPKPSAAPKPSAHPSAGPSSDPMAPVDMNVAPDAEAVFISQNTNEMCASSAAQMAISILSGTPDQTKATQNAIKKYIDANSTFADSHDGGAGPLGVANVVTEYTGVPYEERIAKTRDAALRDAAATISRTGKPVLLLVWWGAHVWVMTGFRADSDPAANPNAVIEGVYILDPWYPRTSTIWGKSDPPGAFHDAAAMKHSYIGWTRPEGKYPTRDGKFVYVAPVESVAGV
jgi:hypothetical protein